MIDWSGTPFETRKKERNWPQIYRRKFMATPPGPRLMKVWLDAGPPQRLEWVIKEFCAFYKLKRRTAKRLPKRPPREVLITETQEPA